MITDPKEYYALLYKIQDTNPPQTATLLPSNEPMMTIDLNTRKIEAPTFLGVSTDHQSEIVYFRCARFFDNMDLTNCSCVIQYINAVRDKDNPEGEGRLYPVPFIDKETLADSDEIIIPWAVGYEATKTAGDIQFSVQFYKMNDDGTQYIYNLNTLPAKSKILDTIITTQDEDYDFPTSVIEAIWDRLNVLEGDYELYWIDL